jgi:hypothetical protein
MAEIPTWQNGRFASTPEPDWWESTWDKVISDKAAGRLCVSMGAPERVMIEAYELPDELGWMVSLEWGGFITTVWMQTEADMLDFMTTRAPAWMALPPPKNAPPE